MSTSDIPTVRSSIDPDVLNRQIDRLFDEAVGECGTSGDHWVPACNVREDESGFYVEVALPGWEPSQITLEMKDKILTVSGEQSGEGSGHYHLQEIGCGSFTRVFTLPASIDHENARAVHANGLLTISFPKREEAKARRILIEAA
jgi:HSP20 family protein